MMKFILDDFDVIIVVCVKSVDEVFYICKLVGKGVVKCV